MTTKECDTARISSEQESIKPKVERMKQKRQLKPKNPRTREKMRDDWITGGWRQIVM